MQVVQGNPHSQQIAQTGATSRGPGVANHGKPTTSPAPTAPVVDQIDLSPAAQEMVNTAASTARGNSANSMAHQARAMMAEGNPALEGMSFGKVVSGLANGSLDLAPPPAEPADAADVPATEDTGEVIAPTDPAEVVAGDEPATTEEILAEEVVAEEIVTEEVVAEEIVPEETVIEDSTAPVEEAPVEILPETEVVEIIDPDSEIVEILDAADEETPIEETV